MKPFPTIPNTKLFLAGGCVRDSLRGVEPKDRDFVAITPFSFDEFVEAVGTVGKVFVSKPEFLTVRASIDGEPIDFTFPRAESDYSDFRHPSVVERVQTLESDASRRDFTINAMFMSEQGEIIDFFKGRESMRHRMIQAVGTPQERFVEDPLRILRGIRFECKLDFQIEGVTFEAMKSLTPLLSKVSAERIREEINGALLANPEKAVRRFASLHIFDLMAEKGLKLQATAKEKV